MSRDSFSSVAYGSGEELLEYLLELQSNLQENDLTADQKQVIASMLLTTQDASKENEIIVVIELLLVSRWVEVLTPLFKQGFRVEVFELYLERILSNSRM